MKDSDCRQRGKTDQTTKGVSVEIRRRAGERQGPGRFAMVSPPIEPGSTSLGMYSDENVTDFAHIK